MTDLADNRKPIYIAIDFDGTLVEHMYPEIGKPVPGAIDWCKRFHAAGAKLILWTMRSDSESQGPVLSEAVAWCRSNGIELHAVNENPSQRSWSNSPKSYAHIYIDDANAGCPLTYSSRMGARDYVDWDFVGPVVMRRIDPNFKE